MRESRYSLVLIVKEVDRYHSVLWEATLSCLVDGEDLAGIALPRQESANLLSNKSTPCSGLSVPYVFPQPTTPHMQMTSFTPTSRAITPPRPATPYLVPFNSSSVFERLRPTP